MADTKLHDLAELTARPAVDDEMELVDRSDTSMDADGTNKRIKAQTFLPIIVRRTADSSAKTNNTLANDDTLLWAVAANEVWYYQGWLQLTAANATMDLQLAWAVPSGTTMSWGPQTNATLNGWAAQATTASQIPLLTAAQALALGTASGGTIGMSIAGTVVVSSTAGNVNLQWAQNTTDAGNLIMKVNSLLTLHKLA